MKRHRDLEESRDRFPRALNSPHGSVIPADIRRDDRVAAELKSEGQTIGCKLWRLSPFGIEIVLASDTCPTTGEETTIELTIEGRSSIFPGIVVETCSPFDEADEKLCAIRFTTNDTQERVTDPNDERRNSSRWLCSEGFYPTCVTPTPGRINDYIYFRIYDVSATGLRMRCSLRNKHLLPEMKLELFAQFPGAESAQLDVVIRRVRIEEEAGKDVLAVGVEFENVSFQARQSIGQYLMQFSIEATPAEIVDAGFKIQSVALGTEFYFLKTTEDYQKVLELRRIAHLNDGNILEEVGPEALGDINDARSRIIVGKIGGEVVATARLRYNELDAPLEHEAYMEWPSEFPRRDQIVEISRAATHPNYRQGDLFAALWKHMASYALQKQRPYILIGSHPNLVKFYRKVGFTLTGHSHSEDVWTVEQHLMLCNIHEAVMGKSTHPLYWNQLYEPIVDRAVQAGTIVPNEMDKIRMSAYRKLSWLSKLVFGKPKRR